MELTDLDAIGRDIPKALFGYSWILMNPHVLGWIGVELIHSYPSQHMWIKLNPITSKTRPNLVFE